MTVNTANDILRIEHLHPEVHQPRAAKWMNMLAEMAQLRRALQQARNEIGYLTTERDDLVHALRSWASPEQVITDQF